MAHTLGAFAWHEALTTDPDAAETFYKKVVGWDTAPFGDSPTPYTMFMAGEAPAGGLMKLPDEAAQAGAPPHWMAYISTPDADKTTEDVKKLGGKVLMGPHTMPGVGRFAILQDPQGASFAVITGEGDAPPEQEPTEKTFSWHELATTEPDAAWQFYQKVFGWSEKGDMDMGPAGKYQMFGRDRFSYGGIYRKPDEMQAPPNWLHYAQVESADAAAERATQAGGKVINGPMEVPGGDRIAVIQDPQGGMFAVHSKAQ